MFRKLEISGTIFRNSVTIRNSGTTFRKFPFYGKKIVPEVQAYMELFHAKRSSKAVTYALTTQYGSCGEYQPTGTLGFELENLAQSTLKVL